MASVAMAAMATALMGTPAQAQWFAEAGVERFDWREDTPPIDVHEHGPRLLIAGGWMQPKTQGPLFAYRGELYGGTVTYDGALLLDPSIAVSGETAYVGTTQAAQFRWRWAGTADGIVGIEYEAWSRQLSSTQEETYRIVSLRLGAEHLANDKHAFVAGGGVRVMLSTHEQSTLLLSGVAYDVELEPGHGSNVYLHAGYRVAPHVTLLGYWDGMRLGRSNTATLNRPSQPPVYVWQPASDMWRLGVRFVYGW